MLRREGLLNALAHVYRGATEIRNALYDSGLFWQWRSELPVVCVGNLTAGGNGKTPLVRFLSRELKRRGYSPVVLSRGFGGSARGPHVVQQDDQPELVGDEPLLLARDGHFVVVSRNRVEGAKFIERRGLGNLIILDDGFQHRRLARNVNIVCIASGTPQLSEEFLAGRLLPSGLFREDRDAGLKRADLAVFCFRGKPPLDQRAALDPRVLKLLPGEVPVFTSSVHPVAVARVNNGTVVEPQEVVALSGIARPEGFFETLNSLGFSIVVKEVFPDHFLFTADVMTQVREKHPNQLIVVTEKDAVKLSSLPPSLVASIAILRVEAKVNPHDAFLVAIQRLIAKRDA